MSLTAAESLEITQLVTRADNCATARDADGYAKLFTGDGVMRGSMGRARGRAALRDAVATVLAAGPPDPWCVNRRQSSLVVSSTGHFERHRAVDDRDRLAATALGHRELGLEVMPLGQQTAAGAVELDLDPGGLAGRDRGGRATEPHQLVPALAVRL